MSATAATGRNVRVPGQGVQAVPRPSGVTEKDAPPAIPERPTAPIPAALAGAEMVSSAAESEGPLPSDAELAQARAMAAAMAPIAKQFARVADSMEREETKVAPLPPKHSAPMYDYDEIEAVVREGRLAGLTPDEALAQHVLTDGTVLKFPLLTSKGWLLEAGPRFGAVR